MNIFNHLTFFFLYSLLVIYSVTISLKSIPSSNLVSAAFTLFSIAFFILMVIIFILSIISIGRKYTHSENYKYSSLSRNYLLLSAGLLIFIIFDNVSSFLKLASQLADGVHHKEIDHNYSFMTAALFTLPAACFLSVKQSYHAIIHSKKNVREIFKMIISLIIALFQILFCAMLIVGSTS
jgi:hypothetical protein